MQSKNRFNHRKNAYVSPQATHNPVFGAVQHTYSTLATKYGLNTYFDVRQTRNISYLPNILQRAKALAYKWPDEQAKLGEGSVAKLPGIK